MDFILSKQAFRALKLDAKSEGIIEGRDEILKIMVSNMIDNGFSDEKIMRIANISQRKLMKFKN